MPPALQDTQASPAAAPVDETLNTGQKQKLKRAIKRLRNSNTKARGKAEEEVIAFGRGAIPELVDAATSTHAGQQDALVTCLMALTDGRDRVLVFDSLYSGLLPLRRFAARKSGELDDEELLAALPPLLEDEDEIVRVEAALSLTTRGREDGLITLAEIFDGPWDERILASLDGVRDIGPHRELIARLTIDPERERDDPVGASAERIVSIRMLAAIGDEPSRAGLVRALDDGHNLVQRHAINALRRLLEDKDPMEPTSIFDQINEVNRLKRLAAER